MEINKRQKNIIIIGLIVFGIMCLFPPWVVFDYNRIRNIRLDAGYSFIFWPPTIGRLTATIDIVRLFVQWICVGVVTGGITFLLKDAKSNRE